VSKPVESQLPDVRTTTIVHGRIVGLEEVAGRVDIKLQARGRGKIRLAASAAVLPVAVKRFGRGVRIRARARLGPDGVPEAATWRVLSIEEWEEADFLDGIDELKERLRERGVKIDARRALATLRDENVDG